jgi:hypothetical protein
MTLTEAVLWGCLGGALPDVLRVIGMRYKGAPDYLRETFFWVSALLLVGVAALTTYLLSPTRIVDAIAIGFSAPEILSTALGKKPPRIKGVRARLTRRKGAEKADSEDVVDAEFTEVDGAESDDKTEGKDLGKIVVHMMTDSTKFVNFSLASKPSTLAENIRLWWGGSGF